MSKQALTDLVSGQQGWDARVNDNNAILRDGPLPVKEYTSLANLLAVDPAANDRSIAFLVTGGTTSMWFSDGTRWVPVGAVLKGHTTHTGGTGEVTQATLTVPADMLPEGAIVRIETWTYGHGGGSNYVVRHKVGGTQTIGITVNAGDPAHHVTDWFVADAGSDKAAWFTYNHTPSVSSVNVNEADNVTFDVETSNDVVITLQLVSGADTVRIRYEISVLFP